MVGHAQELAKLSLTKYDSQEPALPKCGVAKCGATSGLVGAGLSLFPHVSFGADFGADFGAHFGAHFGDISAHISAHIWAHISVCNP